MVALLCYILVCYIFGVVILIGPIGSWVDESFDIKSDAKLGFFAFLASLFWPIPTVIAAVKFLLSWIGNYVRNF